MRIASIADVKANFSTFLRESERGPIIITRNGKPAAALVNVVDDDDVEQLILTYSPRFKAILQDARQELAETGGIPHDEFWRQMDADYVGE
jgi:prevent-host-death family protein